MDVFQDLDATIFSQIYSLVREPPLNYSRGYSFLTEQIIFFTSYLHNLFFSHSASSKIFISLKKNLSRRFDPKLDLVFMAKEPSEASVHKWNLGGLIMPSEVRLKFFKDH